MNLSTFSSHPETALPDFRAYEKFAATSYDEEKIVTGCGGHKIQIATKGPTTAGLAFYIDKENGLEYALPQEKKEAIVDHFKKALELKYGEKADTLFSLSEEAEALDSGLSHHIVQKVAQRANLPILINEIEHTILKTEQLQKNDPLFQKIENLEHAKKYLQKAAATLENCGNSSHQEIVPLITKLRTISSELNNIFTQKRAEILENSPKEFLDINEPPKV